MLGGLVIAAGRWVIAGGRTCCDAPLSAGFAAYDPVRRSWRSMPPHPGSGVGHPIGAWTGKELVVFGESTCPTCPASSARPTREVYAFTVGTWSWRRLPPAPVALRTEYATWTGREVLAVGAPLDGEGWPARPALLRYSPTTNSWRVGAAPPGTSRVGVVEAWSGDRWLVWGGATLVPPLTGKGRSWLSLRDGLTYDPRTNRWGTIPAAPVPGASGAVGAWTGRELLFWGGWGTSGGGADRVQRTTGAAYDPTSGRWRSLEPAPSALRLAVAATSAVKNVGAWTGSQLIVVATRDWFNTTPVVAAGYDPVRRRWEQLPGGTNLATVGAVVWTGRSLALVGGFHVGDEAAEGVPANLVEGVSR